MRRHKGAWMFWVVAMFAWFAPGTVKATPEPGLNVTVYNNFGYNNAPPLPTLSGRPVVGTTTQTDIDHIFDSQPLFNMYEDFIVKYEGYITSPTTATITFYPAADDGTKLYIDGQLIDNNWFDKGGGGNLSTPVEFVAGVPKPITLWYYENGGDAWVNLAWNLNGNYVTVPADAFTKTSESAYTTTTTSATTTTASTTTVQTTTTTTTIPSPTTTTSSIAPSTTTTMPPTTTSSSTTTTSTTLPESTTTTSSTTVPSATTSTTTTEVSTTTSSSTTTLPTTTTTTTEPVQTTTTTSTTTTTEVPATTTTTISPPTQTTSTIPEIVPEPASPIVVPDTTLPETFTTTEPETTVPDTNLPETFTTYPDVPHPSIPDPNKSDLPENMFYPSDPEGVVIPIPLNPVLPPVEPDQTTVPAPEVEPAPDETKQPTDTTQPQEYTTETTLIEETDSSLTTLPPIIENEEVSEFIENIENATVEELLSNVDNLLEQELSNEELKAVFDAVFNDNLSDEETIELAQEVLKGELDAEEFGTVLDAIFDKVVTDEVLIETFTAVLETKLDAEKFEAIVNVLESEVISKKQVAEVVTLIIEQEGGVNAEQATELATSSKVLESIDGEQATEVFDAVVASEVSPEDGAAIVEAVQNAPEEVKEAFEEEINVFEGVFDGYVPIGSSISVGARRAVIAATAVLFVAPLPIPTTSSSQTVSSRKKG